MSENRNVVLSAKDVEVKFRVRDNYLTAIRGISLDLYEGETFAIVGESGSGKSVFTKTFTGMLETNGMISNGSVMFHGKDLTKLKTDKDWEGIRGAKISTIFQDPMTSLNPIRTIGSQITEVIEKHQGVSKAEAKKQAIEIMERVGIKNAADRFDEFPFQYSGGMRQRIVIAIALSCHPEILICDEPTTALDVTIQAQILQLIRDLQKELGFTTLYITHDLGVVANVADRVGVMYGGQIIEYGTVEEIFFDPRHPYTWALLSSMPDLDTNEKLDAIPGTPPNMIYPPKGDAFAERNKYAMEIDYEMQPPMFEVSPTHYAATWLLHPNAPKVEIPKIITERIKRMKERGENHGE
jgi:oligopeptide transport system ATP-binding protein